MPLNPPHLYTHTHAPVDDDGPLDRCEDGFRRSKWLKQASRPVMERLEEPAPPPLPPPAPRPQARAEGRRVPGWWVRGVGREDGVRDEMPEARHIFLLDKKRRGVYLCTYRVERGGGRGRTQRGRGRGGGKLVAVVTPSMREEGRSSCPSVVLLVRRGSELLLLGLWWGKRWWCGWCGGVGMCFVWTGWTSQGKETLSRINTSSLSDFLRLSSPHSSPPTTHTTAPQEDGLPPPLARQLAVTTAKPSAPAEPQQHEQQSRPCALSCLSLHPLLGRRRHPSTSRRGCTARSHPSSSSSLGGGSGGDGGCSASSSFLCTQR